MTVPSNDVEVPLENVPQSNAQTVSEETEETKASPQRMWTKTNVLTGEQEGRLHRKDTVELELTNRAQESGDIDASEIVQSENVKAEQQKASPQRMWTKTNVLTGEKDQRLHRKDVEEMQANERSAEIMDGDEPQDEGVDLDATDEDDDVNDGVNDTIDTMSQVY